MRSRASLQTFDGGGRVEPARPKASCQTSRSIRNVISGGMTLIATWRALGASRAMNDWNMDLGLGEKAITAAPVVAAFLSLSPSSAVMDMRSSRDFIAWIDHAMRLIERLLR